VSEAKPAGATPPEAIAKKLWIVIVIPAQAGMTSWYFRQRVDPLRSR
jgi:hypothetical protein